MSAIFIIGKSIETGLPVHVRNAKNGLNSNCVCFECNERLEAVQGSRDWYFRHSNKSHCLGNNETALHEFAKQVLFENNAIATHKKQVIYTDPKKETAVGTFRSDVSAKYLEQDIHFEVVVNHDILPLKREYYKLNKINCIRIDLSDPLLLQATSEEITKSVLHDKSNKSFINWNEDIKPVETKSSSSGVKELLIAAIVFVGGYFLLRKRPASLKRRSRKYRR